MGLAEQQLAIEKEVREQRRRPITAAAAAKTKHSDHTWRLLSRNHTISKISTFQEPENAVFLRSSAIYV